MTGWFSTQLKGEDAGKSKGYSGDLGNAYLPLKRIWQGQDESVIIRGATEEDFDAVAGVWKESWISIGNSNEIDNAVTAADLLARIPDRIAGGWSLFVAECEGRIDAMLAIERAINHLDQIFVSPSAQGRRIGSALLAHARKLMPEEIWLSTAANNMRARDWYEREGFILEKIEYNPNFHRDVAYYRWRAIV